MYCNRKTVICTGVYIVSFHVTQIEVNNALDLLLHTHTLLSRWKRAAFLFPPCVQNIRTRKHASCFSGRRCCQSEAAVTSLRDDMMQRSIAVRGRLLDYGRPLSCCYQFFITTIQLLAAAAAAAAAGAPDTTTQFASEALSYDIPRPANAGAEPACRQAYATKHRCNERYEKNFKIKRL